MNLLPVAHRELRVASRHRGTYWIRFTAAALAIATATIAFLALRREPLSTQGQALFTCLAVVAFLYCLFGGIAATADCVSEEKREGTLGLLFLTDLRPFEVIVGKMMSGSARATLALVAILPVIAVPLLMGGVPPEQVRNSALALLNSLFLALALGVFVSVLARDSRGAVSGAVLSLLVLLVLFPVLRILILDYLLPSLTGTRPTATGVNRIGEMPLAWMLLVNPAILLFTALGSAGAPAIPRSDFWACLATQHLLAWLVLAASCLILPRTWQDRVRRSASAANHDGIRPRARATGATTSTDSIANAVPADRTRTLDREPFAWMILRDRRTQFATWAGLAAMAAVWVWGLVEMKHEWLQAPISLFTLFFAALWIKLRLLSTACRPLHEHRSSGALELLLATPLQPRAIVTGFMFGLRSAFLAPTALVLVAGTVLAFYGLRSSYNSSDHQEILLTFAGGLAVFVLDLVALAWTGAWHSLRSLRYLRALTLSLLQILLLPWVLFIVSLILIGITIDVLGLSSTLDFGATSVLFWWIFLSVAVDAWLIASSAARLRTRFHDLATGRFDSASIAPVPVPASATPTSGSASITP